MNDIEITIRPYEGRDAEQLRNLFLSVGWEADTPAWVLRMAMERATRVLVAYDSKGGNLAGLVRSMDDGVWSANIDCLVVHRDYQKRGIGTRLMRALLEDIKDIGCVNVAPNEYTTVPFYEKLGFEFIPDGRLLQLVRGCGYT